MDNYKLKLTIFILLIVSLLVTLFYAIFGFSLSYLSEEDIKDGRKLKEDLISFLKINNLDTVYDRENNIYYYVVPEDYEKQKYTLKLELDSGFRYKILDHITNIITVNYNKDYNILIYNDDYYYETKVRLTNLPIVSVTTDTDITDNDTNAVFKYINPYNLDKILTYNSKVHIRGATSRWYDKKSYKVEIYDKDFEKEKNINISNFYYGSSFILDAMYRDHSKIRNVFSSEIWNIISDDFTNIDIYSEYVEVFINGEYRGLYAFTEPVNRKNLNLNKSTLNDTSVIVKSNESTIPDKDDKFIGINEDVYLDYELKYPNDSELFNKSWEEVLNKISILYNEDIEKTEEELNKILDINNYVDMLIFNSFIGNNDNDLRKNNYFYLKNLSSKLNIQPWDMEFTFGLRFSEKTKYNFEKDLEDYKNIDMKIPNEDVVKLKKLIINRYWNLRRNVLSEKYLDELLNSYREQLSKGSAKRDSKLWLEYDVEVEIEDIRTWVHNRIKIYDNYIRSLENE